MPGAPPTCCPSGRRATRWVTVNLPLGDITADQTRVARGHRAPIRGRERADDGGAEHGASLRERVGPVGSLRRIARGATGPARGRHHRRRHVVPRDRHLQARQSPAAAAWLRSFASGWARSRRHCPRPSASSRSRSRAASNSCGQHHVADIGFYGNSRKIDKRTAPHFQVILGGQWTENAGSYGLAMGSVPSKAIPEAVEALTEAYAQGREKDERFQGWTARMGKRNVREIIKPFMQVPKYDDDPSFYVDWSDARRLHGGRPGCRRVRGRGGVAVRNRGGEGRVPGLRCPGGPGRRRARGGRRGWPIARCSRRRAPSSVPSTSTSPRSRPTS